MKAPDILVPLVNYQDSHDDNNMINVHKYPPQGGLLQGSQKWKFVKGSTGMNQTQISKGMGEEWVQTQTGFNHCMDSFWNNLLYLKPSVVYE